MAGACTRRRDERECVMEPVPQADYTATRQRNCNHTQKPNINAYYLFGQSQTQTKATQTGNGDSSKVNTIFTFIQIVILIKMFINFFVIIVVNDYALFPNRMFCISQWNVHIKMLASQQKRISAARFSSHTQTQHKWNGFYFTNITTTKRFCVCFLERKSVFTNS